MRKRRTVAGTVPGDDLDFDINTLNAGQMSDQAWGLSDNEMPPLPQKLTPSQAARLAEIFDYLHRGLTIAVENIHANEDGTAIRLNFGEWQTIQAVQLFLARYMRGFGAGAEYGVGQSLANTTPLSIVAKRASLPSRNVW